MAKATKPEALGEAIAEELTLYHKDCTERVNELSAKAAKDLVELTRATAPVGARGSYKKNIASKRTQQSSNGDTYAWYVKPPDHRLTHLLANGHATKNGGRTKANPFLQNACDEVLPAYEAAVERTIKDGK